MSIKLQCPECKTVSVAPDGRAGQYVRCKRCKTKFPIPHGAPTLAAAPGAVAHAPVLPESPTVIDRYEVRELLGSGSYGSVYRAFDPRLKREVALKVLRREMTSSRQAVERFLREAEAAAKLDHPHIVAVFDAGQAGDVYFIASAFIKGGTLASSIPKAGMEPRRAAELTAQLASALGYAHRQGVVHRDVKPANILLDEQGSLRLMDFGLAGWTQDECTRLTQQGAIMGTPAYMAPEQASGNTVEIGPASDLYGAGVVFYELLTGSRPFGGDNAASMMYQIIHTAAPPPSARRAGLDPGVDAICLTAMAKQPADRFADGEAMAAALRAWAPTAICLAEPLAGQAAAAVPNWIFDADKSTASLAHGSANKAPVPAGLPTTEWVGAKETTGPQLGLTQNGPSAPVTIGSSPSRLERVMASRFGSKWKLAAFALAGFILAACIAAMAMRTLAAWREPAQADAPGTVLQTRSATDERPNPGMASFDKELPHEIVNSIGMRLVLIKTGTFLMGSPDNDPWGLADEQPQHSVEITRPFYLGAYPVTQAEYVGLAGYKNPSWFAKTGGGHKAVIGVDTSRFPVEDVGWERAAAFCDVLNRLDSTRPAGWNYALPTEAEWEYACRAGSKTAFFFGEDGTDLGEYAWCNLNAGGRTHPVGMRAPNPWGLYDMYGNLWEWCADWYDKDYYASSPAKDPQGPRLGVNRVLRGGSWGATATYCRSAKRFWHAGGRRFHYSFGFRVCLHPD